MVDKMIRAGIIIVDELNAKNLRCTTLICSRLEQPSHPGIHENVEVFARDEVRAQVGSRRAAPSGAVDGSLSPT
jgi:hypothetical protein